ncbi:hypothetical protein ACLOJK_033133 [Asimina triloba]
MGNDKRSRGHGPCSAPSGNGHTYCWKFVQQNPIELHGDGNDLGRASMDTCQAKVAFRNLLSVILEGHVSGKEKKRNLDSLFLRSDGPRAFAFLYLLLSNPRHDPTKLIGVCEKDLPQAKKKLLFPFQTLHSKSDKKQLVALQKNHLCRFYALKTVTEDSLFQMGTPADKEYAAFEEKVKRTVYVDDLSPQVTAAVLKTALDQFGTVVSIQFIPNYIEPRRIPQCALVEMETAKQAKSVIAEMTNFAFMMSGMPRPVIVRPAEAEMFADRPPRPGNNIQCRWADPKDPEFEVAKKLKYLTRKHATEVSMLIKHQVEVEEKLSEQQEKTLKGNYKKYDMLDSLAADGILNRLARRYNIDLVDD